MEDITLRRGVQGPTRSSYWKKSQDSWKTDTLVGKEKGIDLELDVGQLEAQLRVVSARKSVVMFKHSNSI